MTTFKTNSLAKQVAYPHLLPRLGWLPPVYNDNHNTNPALGLCSPVVNSSSTRISESFRSVLWAHEGNVPSGSSMRESAEARVDSLDMVGMATPLPCAHLRSLSKVLLWN